jgi:hypothetical protein
MLCVAKQTMLLLKQRDELILNSLLPAPYDSTLVKC